MSYAAASDTSAVYFSGRGYHSAAASIAATQDGAGTVAAFNHGSTPSFSDLIDIVNPLQHIPIVNTIYRQLTGDSESAMASIIGGTLYGGPIGAAAAIADLGVHDATGKSTGDNLVALVTGSGAKDTMTAAAAPTAGATATKTAAANPAAAGKTLALAAGAAPFAATPTSAAPAQMAQAQMPQAQMPQALAAKPTPSLGQASMAPMVLGQSATPAPAAVKATAAKPVPLTPSVAVASNAANMSSGPVKQGNYLVFGSSVGDDGAAAEADAKSAQTAAAPLAQRIPVTVTPDAPKQFAVNGGNAAPAKTLPAPTLDGAAAPADASTANAANIAFLHPKVFPVPPRNGPANPVAVLPPPTTGPGALPGGKSQALSAQEMSVAQDPAHNFLSAYTQALDKYRNAQKLAASPIQPATSIITGKPDPTPATPAVATGDDAIGSSSDDETMH
jgi:hypothetical protein